MCSTEERLDGKVAVVTGGNSGMGLEAARELARRGARVIISGRNATTLRAAREDIVTSTANYNVGYAAFDLASFRSVRNFAHELSREPRLDILINNAGGYGLKDTLTEDGLNLMMQVNFFGTFLLTFLLFPLMKASAPSRIINGSAVSMYLGTIDFDHWNDIGRYTDAEASGNAKLAAALITAEWSRRIKGTGVTANSFDPFFVKETEAGRHLKGNLKNVSDLIIGSIGRPKEEVGEQIAYYASAKEFEGVSGKHYKFCSKWPRHWLAQDKALGRRLWREAKRLVRIAPQEDWELWEQPHLFVPYYSIF